MWTLPTAQQVSLVLYSLHVISSHRNWWSCYGFLDYCSSWLYFSVENRGPAHHPFRRCHQDDWSHNRLWRLWRFSLVFFPPSFHSRLAVISHCPNPGTVNLGPDLQAPSTRQWSVPSQEMTTTNIPVSGVSQRAAKGEAGGGVDLPRRSDITERRPRSFWVWTLMLHGSWKSGVAACLPR